MAGLLVRKTIIRVLKQIAFQYSDINLKIDEEKAFLESIYFIKVEGESESIKSFYYQWHEYFKTIQDAD